MAEPNLDKLTFYTGANYMKRGNYSNDAEAPNPINASTAQVHVAHNLGYIPQFVYYVDIYNDGMLWYGGEVVFEGTESTAYFPDVPPVIDAWISTTHLTFNPRGILSGSRPIRWLIYLDYGV